MQTLGGDLGRFRPGTSLMAERQKRVVTVLSSRPLDGDEVLLSFEELPSREEVARLRGDYLCVEPARARPLGADEWFEWQLIGLRAVTADGEELGVVGDVEEQRSSHVIVVADGTAEHRYPLVREWVRSVDVDAGVIVITPWPEDDG